LRFGQLDSRRAGQFTGSDVFVGVAELLARAGFSNVEYFPTVADRSVITARKRGAASSIEVRMPSQPHRQ
jgi:predicted methyltransferase